MTEHVVASERAGQANAPQGSERLHTLVVLVNDRPGGVDRVVGLLRRRRARMQTLAIGRSELPEVVRITVVVDDSEVHVDQLVEQLRKIADVTHVVNLSSEQAVARELALVKVNCTSANRNEIIELGHLCGAHALDITPQTVTLEVTGSEEKVARLIDLLQPYGVLEVARTGRVAMARSLEPNT
ncbi:MAG: acetolactate synthase small subunit [Ktedonobacteraceae bacterium]|nr:acetolactate synthase small subunit [Chloroflexota bacterium]